MGSLDGEAGEGQGVLVTAWSPKLLPFGDRPGSALFGGGRGC